MAVPAFQLNQVSKSYGKKLVLKDLNLEIREGAFYALIGKNGTGKSTLMRILARQEHASNGESFFKGQSFEQDGIFQREQTGYVSEQINYQLPCSLKEIYDSIVPLYPNWNSTLFNECVDVFGLDLSANHKSLSRGQKMQAAFISAACPSPSFLLIDEITSVLDSNARGFVMHYLDQFVKNGGTVVMATNIITELHHHATDVVFLHEGKAQINMEIDALANQYLKIRKPVNTQHEIFHNPHIYEVGSNSDGSVSYLIPKEAVQNRTVSTTFLDRRGITLEELFIYITRSIWR